MKSMEKTIDALADELSPVRPVRQLNWMLSLWLAASLVWVVGVSLALGPLRPGVEQQLLSSPRFLAEMLFGFAAIMAATGALFYSAVPGALSFALRAAVVVFVGIWLLNFVLSLFSPALEPSMLGKRAHCFIETILYALPPMLIALILQRRLYPLRPGVSAMYAGLAAGLMPAWFMQIACMYEPGHIFLLHILPGAAVVPCALALALLLPKRQ